MASKKRNSEKKDKKINTLKELIAIERALHDKYSKVVNSILTLAKKETKKGKLKAQAERLKNVEKKLIEVDQAIGKQKKIEKKADKAVKKSSKKKEVKASGKKTKKTVTTQNQPLKKRVVKTAGSANQVRKTVAKVTAPPAVNDGTLSTAFNAKMAIAALQNIQSQQALSSFIKGEKRATVLARAKSRMNALN